MNVSIEPANREDFGAILALLEDNELTPDELEEHLETALVAREADRLVGSVGLELYSSSALLRSVAVSEDLRGGGLGRRLTYAALDLARERGVVRAYLMTETADGYFPRFGFKPIDRSEVPQNVQRSVEFTSACPESAQVMVTDQPSVSADEGYGAR